jgi:hypothetical protein
MNTSLVCVCTDVSSGWGSRSPRNSKTARRRRVSAYTHGRQTFLTLLHSLSSSSVVYRLVTLHTTQSWLNCEPSHNVSAEVAADG